MCIHLHHTHPYSLSAPSCYSSTAVFNNCYSELMPYTALANSYVSTMRTNSKAMPINDNDYSFHITAIELVYYNQSYMVHIMPHHATSY